MSGRPPTASSTARSQVPTTSETVRRQAARSLSLDHDGSGWEAIGERDPVLGALQARYDWLRPVCFYSAYEAATSFVIGQRIAMRQARVVKDRLAAEHGDPIEIGGQVVRPFPRPQRLVDIAEVQGISAVKVARLRDLARAALDGVLDTERLRALPEDEALSRASGAAGRRTVDRPGDPDARLRRRRLACRSRTRSAGPPSPRSTVSPEPPDDATWTAMSDAWRPYRMWATVLLHMAWRREQAVRRRATGRAARPVAPSRSDARRRSAVLARRAPAVVLRQRPLAQPDRQRRHLDQLVAGDELERGLEGDRAGRRQPERLVVRVGPDVGELLLLGRVDVHVARPAVLADDHALVDLDAGADEQLGALLEVEQAVGVGRCRRDPRRGRRSCDA